MSDQDKLREQSKQPVITLACLVVVTLLGAWLITTGVAYMLEDFAPKPRTSIASLIVAAIVLRPAYNSLEWRLPVNDLGDCIFNLCIALNASVMVMPIAVMFVRLAQHVFVFFS